MKSCNSNFWIGLGIGSIIGAFVYRFSCSSKGRELKEKVYHSLHKVHGEAEGLMDEAKDKALDAGTKVADKVADGAFNVAEKADDVKNKVHSFADNARR